MADPVMTELSAFVGIDVGWVIPVVERGLPAQAKPLRAARSSGNEWKNTEKKKRCLNT